MNHLLEIKSSNSLLKCIAFVLKDFKVKCRKDINSINETFQFLWCREAVSYVGNGLTGEANLEL